MSLNGQDEAPSDGSSEVEISASDFAASFNSMKGDESKSKVSYHCELCGKAGHTSDRCHQNPDNPNNRLPEKLRNMLEVTKKNSPKEKKPRSIGEVELAGAVILKTTINPPHDSRTYADSGATVHCFNFVDLFVAGTLQECPPRDVMLVDKSCVTAEKCGDLLLPFENANVMLKNAMLIPLIGYNLVSTGTLADNDIESLFTRHEVCLTFVPGNILIGYGKRDLVNGMYILPHPYIEERIPKAF